MRFLVDAQLSPRVADWLRLKGHVSDHVSTALGAGVSDKAILDHAARLGAIIVSKDGDFVGLIEGGEGAPPLLRIKVGNAVNRVLLARFEAQWSRIESELSAGERVVELG